MPDSVSREQLAYVHIIFGHYSLNYFSYLINFDTRSANRNSLVQCLLSHLHDFEFDFVLWLAIEDCEVVVSVVSVNIGCYINVYLVSKI